MVNDKALQPLEQKNVLFYDDEITAVLIQDGEQDQVYIPVQPICTYLSIKMLTSLRKAYGDRVSEPIPHSVKVEESPASGGGMTVFEYAPNSEPAKAYQVLVDRMYHD